MDQQPATDKPASGRSVAEQLSAARAEHGLTLAEVSNRTRLPARHIKSLETGDYEALPGVTYAIGFTRNYARVLDLDEQALVAQLREELEYDSYQQSHWASADYQPANPSRIPPKFFAWGAVIVLALILIGYFVLRGGDDSDAPLVELPPSEAQSETNDAQARETTAAANEASPTGPVVLTATERVWLRVYEDEGERLYENELEEGQSYTVPAGASDPLILTGRPQALTVTIGGEEVAPLGPADQTVADLPISADALLARDNVRANP